MTKLFVAIFLERPNDGTAKSAPSASKPRVSFLSWVALLSGAFGIVLLGCTPHILAEKISSFGLAFVGGHEISHTVDYLAWQNLKGVCISLLIAAVVYPLFIRGLLMKKDSKLGRRVYANRWHPKLSLEHLVYIPIGKLLIGLLTGIARFLAALPDRLVKLFLHGSAILCRTAGDLPDLVVLGIRKTVLRPVAPPPEEKPDHPICHRIGNRIDRMLRRKDPNINTVEMLIRVVETIRTITGKIAGNFSFALFMACFGIVIILICLIFLF